MYLVRQLRIGTQVLIFLLLVYVLILALGVSLLIVNVSLVTYLITDSQNNLLVRQIDYHLTSLSYLASNQVQQQIQRSENRLYVVNKLFNLVQKQAFESDSTLQCLNHHIDDYAELSSYCFGIFGDIKHTNITSDNEFKKLQSLLTYSFPMMDNQFDLLTTSLTKSEIFSIWPGQIMPRYIPSSQAWYKNHINEISKVNRKMYDSYFSVPMIQKYQNQLATTPLTMSIYNQDNSVFGIASSQLNLSLILPKELFDQINSRAFIADKNGFLIFENRKLDSLTQLKDTRIFSSSDQQKIIAEAHGVKQQNNCSILNNTQFLCLRNKTSDEELIAQASLIKSGNLILTIAINPSSEIKFVEDSNQLFYQQLDDISQIIIQNALILLVVSLIIVFSMLVLIQYAINQIIYQAKLNIYKQKRTSEYMIDQMYQLHEQRNIKVQKKVKEAGLTYLIRQQ